MKKRVLILPACIAAAALCCSSARADSPDASKFPFYPSLITTATGEPVKPNDFESPVVCSGCHEEIFQQWKGSMHANAFRDPVFNALWKIGEQETKGFTRQLCGGCHAGAGVVSNDIVFKDGRFQASDIVMEGVHCDVCHTVQSSIMSETPSYEPRNASLVVAPGEVKRGPYKDSESQHHECAYSELHTRSEFCANCHQVVHPVNNFHIERTYDEWKHSVYAEKGIQCQDCHMMPVEKAIEAARTLKRPVNPGRPCIIGPRRDNMFTHEFVGANFTVTALLGHPEHAGIAEKRLKSAAELAVQAPPAAGPGEPVTVSVTIKNIAAGHNLPTSLTEVRQMWLDVTATDAAGKELFRSGELDDRGNIPKGTLIYNASAVDKDGHHTVKPWEIVRFEYNRTIPPKGSAVEKFTFSVPPGTAGPVTVLAVLRYRSYPQKVANLLLGKDAPVLPVVDMTQKKCRITVQ